MMFTTLLLFACSPKPTPPAEVPVEVAPAVTATPGLNDRFLNPDMNIQDWIDRFEGESREVVLRQPEVLAQLDLKPGDRIADIGAGTGLYTGPFSDTVGPDGAVYAVDISPAFLDRLRGLAADNSWDNVQVVEGSPTSVNLPEDSVDAAFICDTYHHFDAPAETLASLRAALKPGGRLYVLDFERIEGVSSEFIMGHVRGDKEVFAAEIAAAGFIPDGELDAGLTDNYLLRFQSP